MKDSEAHKNHHNEDIVLLICDGDLVPINRGKDTDVYQQVAHHTDVVFRLNANHG
jgi:hypothetical protein